MCALPSRSADGRRTLPTPERACLASLTLIVALGALSACREAATSSLLTRSPPVSEERPAVRPEERPEERPEPRPEEPSEERPDDRPDARPNEPPPPPDASVPERPELLAAAPFLAYRGHDRAALWIAPVERDAPFHVVVTPKDRPESRIRVDFSRPAAGAESRTAVIDGLIEHTNYAYQLFSGEQPVASGRFRTGPRPGAPVRGTIALASCMNPDLFPQQPAWNVLASEQPELLIHLGDNTYGVVAERPARSRAKHMQQRRVPEYARLLRNVASLAIWDDHDYSGNNSDGTSGAREQTLELFRELFPNPTAGTDHTPGIFFSTAFGDVDLFLLDGRYHRSRNADPDDDAKELLGQAQFEWLKERLRTSTATFKLIAVGSPLQRGHEGWSLYTHARARLVAMTREVSGMVFLTGDIHRSEFHRWPRGAFGPSGYDVFEVTSSGIAVRAREHMFVTLHVDTTLPDPEIGVRVFHLTPGTDETTSQDRFTIRRSELEPLPD